MKLVYACVLAAACAGCANHPRSVLPTVPLESNFAELPSGASNNQHLSATWWETYHDPELNRLEQQLLRNSPDLAGALARYHQARATLGVISAAQYPTVGASLSVQRDRQSDRRPLRGATSPSMYNSGTLGADFEYEVDLWGRIRQQVSGGTAQEQAASADLAFATIALQIQLANIYLELRGMDADIKLLKETEVAYTRQVQLVEQSHHHGTASGLDLARAQAQLESTRSTLAQRSAQRSVQLHAIAALVGESAVNFALAPGDFPEVPVIIPVTVPSELLERRADIVAARFRVAAASDNVGVARSAFFPSLTLGASAGVQSGDLARFVQMPNLFWAVGPTLATTLVDGGRRKSQIAGAEAVLDEAGQQYRSTVLAAFQQVQDQLTLLNKFREASDFESASAAAAQRALHLAMQRYERGAASYLEVVTAQTAYLQSRRSQLDLATRHCQAGVRLIQALGGGWNAS